MPKAIDRIMLFLNEIGLSARQFDISIGTANGYTLRMKKNNASVGSDVIEKIINTYPQINLVWLITGQGTMFVDKISNKNSAVDLDMNTLERLVEKTVEAKLSKDNAKLRQELLDEIDKEIQEAKRKL